MSQSINLIAVLLICAALLSATGSSYFSASAAPMAAFSPDLGAATTFAVLGGSTVTNTGLSSITGDLGVSPGTAVSGFGGPPAGTVYGTIYDQGAPEAAQARSAVTAAYADLAQACDQDLSGQNLGGRTLTPGVYCFGAAAELTGVLTLDFQGNANGVFIFRMGSTLTTASASSVAVINGGKSRNVWWRVGTSATLGEDTVFAGNILANASITLNGRASMSGAALAGTGAVTMINNTISIPSSPTTDRAPGVPGELCGRFPLRAGCGRCAPVGPGACDRQHSSRERAMNNTIPQRT